MSGQGDLCKESKSLLMICPPVLEAAILENILALCCCMMGRSRSRSSLMQGENREGLAISSQSIPFAFVVFARGISSAGKNPLSSIGSIFI